MKIGTLASKTLDFTSTERDINLVKVVCLASTNHQNAIAGLLQPLNNNLSFIDGRSWMEGKIQEPGSRVILVLPEKNLMADPIVKAILATPNTHYLVIFFPPLTDEIGSILNGCIDFCQWPCDALEVAFRLRRWPPDQSPSIDSSKADMESVAWKNLNLIGRSNLFLDTLSFIKKASNCSAPVLIEGETGCGKEVAARAIHYLGCRKDYPFIPINCGAIPDHLFENELFGHEKGAYTDAKQNQIGLTEQAHRGTLFLDEIETLSPKGQVTLLRFIEDNTIRPLGAKESRKVDVKIIGASNVSLSELVSKGLFRQDLLFRLNLLHLNLPPLRERRGDIQCLAEHFMEKYRRQYRQPMKRLHPDAIAWMNDYHWPGNIRELENFVHRSFLLSQDVEIIPSYIRQIDRKINPHGKLIERGQKLNFETSFNEAKNDAINHFEQSYLTWLISKAEGNVTLAAEIARKERRAIGKLLKKHAINPTLYRGA